MSSNKIKKVLVTLEKWIKYKEYEAEVNWLREENIELCRKMALWEYNKCSECQLFKRPEDDGTLYSLKPLSNPLIPPDKP